MVYKVFFDKKARSGVTVNAQLAEELHKTVITKSTRDLNTMFGLQI